jgi:polysaccharide biosynthesis PFTS motif protein
MSKRLIIFEYLTWINAAFAMIARLSGLRVLSLRVSPAFQNSALYQWIYKKESHDQKNEYNLTFEEESQANYEAYSNVENLFEKNLDRLGKGIYEQNIHHFNSERVSFTFKKAYLDELVIFFQVKTFLEKVRRNAPSANRVAFFPDKFCLLGRLSYGSEWVESFLFQERISINIIFRIFNRLCLLMEKLVCIAAFYAYPLVILGKIRKINKPCDDVKKTYQLGIRSYKTDMSFLMPSKQIDFLIDQHKINKEDAIFCIETTISDEYEQTLKDKKYHYVYLDKMLACVSWNFLQEVIMRKFFFGWLRYAPRIFFSPGLMIKTLLHNWDEYLRWMRFAQVFQLKHYVAYNDFGLRHVIRNSILSDNGIETWFFMHSRHNRDVFAKKNQKGKYLTLLSIYLSFDNFVRWSGNFSPFIEPTRIDRFFNIGCLWSEKIVDYAVMREDIKQKLIKNDFLKKVKHVIVSFDTTFGYDLDLVLRPKEMDRFFAHMLNLLDDFPDVGILYKQKNMSDSQMEQNLLEVPNYDRFISHDRCLCLDYSTDTTQLIAISDLVISVAFTSPTLEALGARKKAIFLDPTERFRDAYYDKTPQLVAYCYDELRKLVDYWLFKVTDDDFHQWVDQYIVNEIDAFADGKAITRFRELLTKEG